MMTEKKITGSNGDYGIYNDKVKTIPTAYNENYRYMLEMKTDDNTTINSENHLVVICMNPSTASDKVTDPTVDEIIRTMFIMGYKGFTLFNLYPERATKPKDLTNYTKDKQEQIDKHLKENIDEISKFLECNPGITEVWGAWGDIDKKVLKLGKEAVLELLKNININIFYFVKKTKNGNPPHPLNIQNPKIRQEKIKYLKIDKHLQ